MSGCLLFEGPVNKAPVVTLTPDPPATVYRGEPTTFWVSVADEDSPGNLYVRWGEFPISESGGCDWITPATWKDSSYVRADQQSVAAPYDFEPNGLAPLCLCAMAVDHQGASGQKCLRIQPTSRAPQANITDLAGKPIPAQVPKCAPIQLSALTSRTTEGDTVAYDWRVDYAGTDPKGSKVNLAPCPSATTQVKQGATQCFTAAAIGTYTVTLTITATAPGTSSGTTSQPARITLSTLDDTPACIQQASPDLSARLIYLARGSGPDSSYESRTFQVSSVGDDCEPYPIRTDAGVPQQLVFIWSVMDGTRGKTDWEPQTVSSTPNEFTVDHQNFPNARPGDTIGVRVEIRDTPTQALFSTVGPACKDPSTALCCGPSACSAANTCVRWTTWTVNFQP